MNKWSKYQDELDALKANNLYRKMTVFDSAQSSVTAANQRQYHMFSSNSYLDLCNDDKIKAYASEVMKKYGTGSGGSRLTTGTSRIHVELERLIANFKKREASVVFATGYMANVGVISALASKDDIIYSDELNHASIIDGCRLSRAKVIVYKHNDMADLEEKIRLNSGRSGLIVSDGVFSMDGDIVDLPNLVALADKYSLLSVIDDAHATGVIGKTGRGTEEYYDMEGSVDVVIGTLSKAIGSEGGFVCGSQLLIQYIINKARSFIFSTSLSPASMAASIGGIRAIMNDLKRLQRLHQNTAAFALCLRKANIIVNSQSAIVPIVIGDEARTLKIAEKLKERGFYVSAIRYPTVARGSARLRVTFMSSHTTAEAEALASEIIQCLSEE